MKNIVSRILPLLLVLLLLPACGSKLPQEAQHLVGDWELTGLGLLTTEEDNGIYSIDATMSITGDFQYGRNLSVTEEGMASDIGLDGFFDGAPYAVKGMDFTQCTQWAYELPQGGTGVLTLEPGALTLSEAYDEESGELRLTRSGEVEILSQSVNGYMTKSGFVQMDVILIFERVQEQ